MSLEPLLHSKSRLNKSLFGAITLFNWTQQFPLFSISFEKLSVMLN